LDSVNVINITRLGGINEKPSAILDKEGRRMRSIFEFEQRSCDDMKYKPWQKNDGML
jgi:hypothetical protein